MPTFLSWGRYPHTPHTATPCHWPDDLSRGLTDLQRAGLTVHLIGGAFEAGELDAKRAIDMGTRLAATL